MMGTACVPLETENISNVESICHQMQPMLRQLRALKIANQLAVYEKDPRKILDNIKDFPKLKSELIQLLDDLESSINNQDHIS